MANKNRYWNNISGGGYDYGYSESASTPNYARRRARGELLPENNYSFKSASGAMPWRSVAYKGQPSYPSRFDQFYGGPYDMQQMCSTPQGNGDYLIYAGTPTDSSEYGLVKRSILGTGVHRTLAGNKISKKLGSRDIDLGVALGEARETAAFVQGAMIRSFVAARHARKGDLSGMINALGLSKTVKKDRQRIRDIADAAANTWLGYSYAVRPLLADVFGACKALEKRYQVPQLVTTRAQSTEDVDFQCRTSLGTTNYPDFGRDVFMDVVGTYGVRRKLTFEVENPLKYQMSQLGLTNPLNVAWELVTLSFVVDWFLPVGDFINGLVPPQGITNVQGTETEFGRFSGKGGFIFPDGNETPCSINERWKRRRVNNTIPQFHVVGATFDLGYAQIASGLSLLWSYGSGESQESKALRRAQQLNKIKSESAFRQAIQDSTHLVDSLPKKRK